jgi:hypothetical protein
VPPVRISARLGDKKRTDSQSKPPDPTELKIIAQGAFSVQCLDGILQTVDVYSQWAFGVKAHTIFQKLLEEGKHCPGDNGRYEIKLNLLPEVTERLKDEDDDRFYDRHAGSAWLIIDTHNVPASLFQVLELTDVESILNQSMASLLFGDAREKTFQRQDPHTDKRPQDKVSGVTAPISVSAAKDNKANIGIIRNSANNLERF